MASKPMAMSRPIWVKQAEEAKLKSEEEKAAAAKAAFEATFNDVERAPGSVHGSDPLSSDSEESKQVASQAIGPVDPAKCTAAGSGVTGGAAGSPASFVVVSKDSEGRRVPHGGASIKIRITPDASVGGSEQEAMVKDHGDGTYTATYGVTKRGNYIVSVECNGQPVQGSPFPVFFSGASGLLPIPNATLPTVSPVAPMLHGILGVVPGILPSSGGVVLPGFAASFGEVCQDHLNGHCSKSDCRFNHPPQQQLIASLASGSTMAGLSQMPMAPAAAAMAAAQSIVAVQAYQAAQARAAAQQKETSETSLEGEKIEALSRTVQVSNLNPLLTVEQLRQLFSYCGTVTNCQIADSKLLGYVEYANSEQAKAALKLNNMEVGGRLLNVEMAKTLPAKKSVASSAILSSTLQTPPLPVIMQQAVTMQQLQFQQALAMQQALLTQQAAARAASVKSATETAAARAAEISKRLKGDADGQDEKDQSRRSRSRSIPHARSRSRSPSPIRYRRDRHSSSLSPIRYRPGRHSGSRLRDWVRRRSRSRDRTSYFRDGWDGVRRYTSMHERRLDRGRDYDRLGSWRRSRSRSKPRRRSPYVSPRHQKEDSRSPRQKKDYRDREYSNHKRHPSKDSVRSVTPVKRSMEHVDNGRSPRDVAFRLKDSMPHGEKQDIKLARRDAEEANERRPSSRKIKLDEEQESHVATSTRLVKTSTQTEAHCSRHSQIDSTKLKDFAEIASGSDESRLKNESGRKMLRQLSSALQNIEEKEAGGIHVESEFCNFIQEQSNPGGARKKEKTASSSEENEENTGELDDWRNDVMLQEREKLKSKDNRKPYDKKIKEREDRIHYDSRDTLLALQKGDACRQTVRRSSDSVEEKNENPDSSFENDIDETFKFTDVKASSDSTFNRSLADKPDASDLDFPSLTLLEENKGEAAKDDCFEHERKKGKQHKHSRKHRHGDIDVSHGDSAEDERDQLQREKRKHKKRHRKDDSSEKHEKKRKRHKHHRHQSPAHSSE